MGPESILAPPSILEPEGIFSGGIWVWEGSLRNDLDDPHGIKPVYLRPPDIRANTFAQPVTL